MKPISTPSTCDRGERPRVAPAAPAAAAAMASMALAGAAALASPPSADAQGLNMLSPLAPRYEIGGFEYTPPEGDGWRETSSSPREFRIVYAEQVDFDKINTRAEFWMHAFQIEDPATAPPAAWLAQTSFEQRKDERGDSLVASSNIELLGGTAGIYTYTLVTKVGGRDVFELFYVLLASDKSGYVAGKLVTSDADYDERPYYRPFLRSLATLKPRAESSAGAAGTADASQAAESPPKPEASGPSGAEGAPEPSGAESAPEPEGD